MNKFLEDARDTSEGHEFSRFYLNRTLCGVLEDMRKCDSTKNYAMLAGLIEEAQILGSRMEDGLGDRKDLLKLNVEMSKAKKAYRALEKEYKALMEKVKTLKN